MYHDVVIDGAEDRSGFPGRDAALYKVTTRDFEEHLAALSGLGIRDSGLALTFDDGGESAMDAADILERHGFVGHFFVTTNYIGTPGFLDAGQVRALHARGHVIGSHSCSHPLRMGHCPWPQLIEEWTQSRAVLEDALGCEVRWASVPGGDFSPSVAEAAARAGLSHLFTSEPSASVRHAFGLDLRGRFTIQRWTTTATVLGLASTDWLPCARQAVVWNAKKLTKQIGGERYLRLRQLLIGHGDEVQWGDTIMRE
jgi:peptidoglycan/xylan/chitin deacetylase (PgdA/CDA1 family)